MVSVTATAQDTRRVIKEASMTDLITRTTTIRNSHTRNEVQAEKRRDSVSPEVWNRESVRQLGHILRRIGPIPSNAIIVNQTPQLEVLKRTSVCITHAALNTVLESLVQGVPQVGIPITVDQPGVATRNALSVSRYPVCLNRQFMERMVLL